MRYGIKENVLNDISQVFEKFKKINKIILFGSRAKGNYKPGSDIDLALIGEEISLRDLNKIHLELDKLYLPYSFDLVIFEKIDNNDLIDHINIVGIPIYTKTNRAI